MRILTSKYWKHFKKTIYQKNGKKKIVKDGKRFEQLIKSILDFEYGEGLWVDTGETWDGSRDFEYREPDYFRWAECKNYEASISLNVLSNTLVMAMIDFADEILIFSYSKIKKPVLDKIIRFADVSGKVVRIYSDESLEDVILKHIDKLKKDFFPEYNLDFDKLYLQPYVSCNVVSDPVTAYTTNADLGLISKKPNTIDFTSILCLSILVYNRNNTSKTFKIEIDWTKTEKCFKVLNNSTSKAIEFELEGNTAANKKIYFQVIKYKSELKLPQITISYDTLRKEYVLGKVKCLWIGECSIQGDLYKKTCYDFNNMLNSNFFKANNIYGTSGTGKSRLLKECEKLALSKGYRVIRFSVEDKYNNEKFVFKLISEFIYTVYDIPYIDNKSIICKNYSSDIYEMFLKINSLNETYVIDNVIPIITKKLMCSKCYITFDNIQFYPKFFVTFINEIVENIVINNKHCKCKMSFVFNTDYMNIYSECSNFYSFLNCNKSLIKSYPINGFANTNETKDFLNILLHDSNINELHLNKIIEKSQNKPYYITAYLSTLELNGILKKRKDSYYIPPNKYSDFEENVSNFPNNVKETIKKRWNLFLIKKNENEAIRIISILHIFQILNTEIIKSFLLSNSVISELCECHFIKLTNKKHNIYCFEHDLIEKFFCEEYFPLCSFAFDNKTPEYSFYWYMKIYQIINKQSISISDLKQLIKKEIPYKIGLEVYTLLENFLLSSINSITELEKYLEIICDICANTREIYGTNESIILYRNLIYKVESDFPEYQSVIHWAWIIISYANLLYENCDYKQAIICVKNLLLYWPESNINNKNSIIYCYLYNRLHVYKRALNKYVTSNSLEWLRKSEILQNTSEVEFLNLVDRGYCNYDCIKSKNKIIFYWESACKIYEKNNILTKKVNYFYIKIRLHLFNKEWNAASKTIETALSTIEVKEEGTYYFTYFKQRYLICKIALLLLNYNSSKKNIIDELFYEVETINYILKSRMIYSIQFLKSIYCFYNKQYLDSFLCIQSSIDELYKSKKLTFQNFYIEQIYENIDYFMANAFFDDVTNIDIKELSNNNIIIRLKKIMKQSLEKNLNIIENHQCTGLLQSDDCKINFPIL